MARRSLPRTVRETAREVQRVLADPILALWSLYILLFPIYVFPSGLPQPGDLVLIPLATLVFARPVRLFPAAIRPTRALLAFTAYVVLVNLLWTVALGAFTLSLKRGFALSILFYVYNTVFFVVALALYARYRGRFIWLTLQVTLAAVVIQVAVSFVYSRGDSRGSVLFNNPNQLGYYALLSASIIALGRRRLGLGMMASVVGFLASAYLAFFSASKAAIGGTAILVVVALVSNPRRMIAASVAFLVLLSFADPVLEAVERTQNRIESDQARPFFEERGYDRILAHKEYWVLGAGEGGYKRFEDTTAIGDHELHSSAGTIFFSYGLFGSLLFVAFCARVVERVRLRSVLVLVPAASYGLSHQSLRFTLLWVLLALFVSLKDFDANRGPPARAAPGPK